MSEDPTKSAAQGAIEAIYKPIESIVKTLAGPAAEEIGLSLRDSVQAWRLKRQIRLFERVKKICEEAGIKPQAVKMPLLFEIMEKGSLEEHDDLQDIWANMLSNAAAPNRASLVTTAFPEILKQLCIEEVKFLGRIYETNMGLLAQGKALRAKGDESRAIEAVRGLVIQIEHEKTILSREGAISLKPTFESRAFGSRPKFTNIKPEEVRALYYDNLRRLGLIDLNDPIDGSSKKIKGESNSWIGTIIRLPVGGCYLTVLGQEFIAACTVPKPLATSKQPGAEDSKANESEPVQ